MHNDYIWGLFKNSEAGKESISSFDTYDSKKILPDVDVEILKNYEYAIDKFVFDNSTISQGKIFDELIASGIRVVIEGKEILVNYKNFDYHFDLIIITTILFTRFPETYLPYFYINCIDTLYATLDFYDITIAPPPNKKEKLDRFKYYNHLCSTLQLHRNKIKLTPSEYCALLYSHSVSMLNQLLESRRGNIPEPSNIWIVGANKPSGDFDSIDSFEYNHETYWQGNKDTRKGDIVLMYCLSPRSYIHSIWIASSDGVVDPFFHWYSQVFISRKMEIPHISLSELKDDIYFKAHPLVRKNFQGVNGYKLTNHDYKNILRIIEFKEPDVINNLPKVKFYEIDSNQDLQNEREVELCLIEPLIKELGYSGDDWIRQYVLKMGTGSSVYPDYVFYDPSSNEVDKMKMLIEAKFEILNNSDFRKAFDQARSYGLRLQCDKIVMADRFAVYIFEKIGGSFIYDAYKKMSYDELKEPDVFQELKLLIGK